MRGTNGNGFGNDWQSGRAWIWGFLALAVIGILILARAKFIPAPSGPPARGGPGGENPLEVAGLVLKPEILDRKILSSGTVVAGEEVELRSETSGRIVAIHFREGTRVRKGTLLVKLNDAELKAQWEKLRYRLKLAEEREYRQKRLLERQAVSQEEYDLALQEKNSLFAERDILQAQLDKTEIRAPFDGAVGLKAVSEGSYVAAGARIAGFFSLHPLKMDFSVPEQYYSQIRPGDSVNVAVNGVDGEVRAEIYALEPKIDPATRMVRIRARFANRDGRIPAGASARIELPLRHRGEALMAPSMAVLPDIQGQKVYLFRAGKAVPMPVAAGYRSEERVQIEGVDPGDTLIVSGLMQLKPGAPVTLAELR